MKSRSRVILALLLLGLAGCATLEGRRVTGGPPGSEDATGVSYYLARPKFAVVRKTLDGGKAASPVNELIVTGEPDPDRRFEVGISDGLFTSDMFKLKMTEQGQVSSLSSSTTDESAKVVVGLAKLAAEVTRTMMAAAAADVHNLFAEAQTGGVITAEEKNDALAAFDLIDGQLKEHQDLDRKAVARYREVAAKVRDALISSSQPNFVGMKQAIAEVDLALAAGCRGLPCDTYTDERCTNVQAFENTAQERVDQMRELDAFDARITRALMPNVPATLKRQRAAVTDALADVLSADTPANRKRLKDATDKYRASVQTVLDVDDEVSGRRLGQRRRILVDFLSAEVPTKPSKAHAAAYEAYGRQLGEVDATIAALLGTTPAKPDEPLVLATQATSRIDDGVYFDACLSKPPSTTVLEGREKVGAARIVSGLYRAVVIGYPLAATSQDTASK